MKRFGQLQGRAAQAFAQAGGQALHVWVPKKCMRRWQTVPTVFKRAPVWAHLFDQDRNRLVATATHLGVRVVLVHHAGMENQHVDLCGKPLELASMEATEV